MNAGSHLRGQQLAAEVARRLAEAIPEAIYELRAETPLQLLIATILAAQSADKQVNSVTETLFEKYPTLDDFADCELEDLQADLSRLGSYRNKAKNVRNTCRLLREQHEGVVPQSVDELVELPGVGRKTAHVVLGNAFGIPSGIVVDTHVGRVARRLGLTESQKPEAVEAELNSLVPQKQWIEWSNRVVLHGRRVCKARQPACSTCCLEDICPRIGVDSEAGSA